jgi:hypothetical protein
MQQESNSEFWRRPPSMTSNTCVKSGAVTAYTSPNSLVMIRSGVRENLTNENGFRHTIVSAITQLLNIFLSSKVPRPL